MSRSLILSFQSASAKYSRLTRKIRKSIRRGEFWRLTGRQRHYLLHKLENLRRRLSELKTQAKLAGAGLALAAVLTAGDVNAQSTKLGPFINTPLKNPLPPPAFNKDHIPSVSLADFDKDGDLEAVLGDRFGNTAFYTNKGTRERAVFEEAYYSDVFNFYFSDPTQYADNATRTTFADVDDDGDLDMVVTYRTTNYTAEPDGIYFYRNVADPGSGPYFSEPGNNPFGSFSVDRDGWASFADIDNDGDKDLIVAGLYLNVKDGQNGFLQVFENVKDGHEPGVDATYVPKRGVGINPLYFTGSYNYISISFADLDEDGDEDFIYTTDNGATKYRRNDGGVFVEQEGTWSYNAQNPGATTGNPFEIPFFSTLGLSKYRSIAFGDLDNDGDKDAIVGIQVSNRSNTESSYVYVENTGHGVFKLDFSKTNQITGVEIGTNGSSFYFDYDHDGDDDIVSIGTSVTANCDASDVCEGYQTRLELTLLLNNNNVYTRPAIGLNPLPADIPQSGTVTMADVDGDGDIDLTVSYYEYVSYNLVGKFVYYENTGTTWVNRTGPANPFEFIETEHLGQVNIDFDDLNADGIPDMVLMGSGITRAYKNTGTIGNPKFERELTWETGFEFSAYSGQPQLVDLDGDGDLDIIVGKYNFMWYYENRGTNSSPVFKQWYSGDNDVYSGGNPFADFNIGGLPFPSAADFDGDGDKDLLYATNDGTFGFYENQNPAPVVVPSRTTITVVPGTATILDSQLAISDPDADNLVKIIVSIVPYQQGKEVLRLSGSHSNMQGAFDAVKGILTITAINQSAATLAEFQAALQSVEYLYNEGGVAGRKGGTPSSKSGGRSFNKNITFYSLDADQTLSTTNTTKFAITHSNDVPVLTPGTSTVTFVNTPIDVLPTIALSDNDDINLVSATITFGGTYNAASDRLEFNATGAITGTFDAATGTLTLTGAGTVLDYQNALRQVKYNNISASASRSRTLQLVINDGESDSNAAVVTLNLAAPVLTPVSISQTYSSGNLVLHPAIAVNDDGTSITSARIGIDTGYVATEDRLSFTAQNGITGTFNVATGSIALTGTATLAEYQAAIRTVTYTNIGTGTRTKQTRYLNLQVNDGTNNSNVSTVVLSIANLAPLMTGAASGFYTSGELVVNGTVVLTDPDDANLTGATVVISGGLNAGEDVLLFDSQNGITGAYTANNGTLTLSGTSSVANYQAALRSVRYKNSSTTPATTDRAFTMSVTDGSAAPVVLSGTVVVINKPPVIASDNRQTSAGGNIALSAGQILSDPDNNLDLSTLVVTSKQGASVSINNGVVTVNYGSIASYKGLDEITITVCDTGGRCRTTTITVEVGADPVIYTGMSPNGDGINDWFHIDFVPEGTQVAIYNRWGDAIFETNDYDNNDAAKRFEGKNKNGTEVIAGSYFYKIKYPDGSVRTGYLLLNR